MKELNTKTGVLLTTYTQEEIDKKIEISLEINDSDGCILFMDEIRSFNINSEHYIGEGGAIELTGWEVSDAKGNNQLMYTNYKGNPLDIPIASATLYYTNPIDSLKSAFEIAAPEFDFDKDFFHIKIIK